MQLHNIGCFVSMNKTAYYNFTNHYIVHNINKFHTFSDKTNEITNCLIILFDKKL